MKPIRVDSGVESERTDVDVIKTPTHVFENEADHSNWDNLRAISPEYFNLALVLLLLCLRYPSVFWYTNKSFSFIFSLLLLLTGIQGLLEYCAASVLMKISWNLDSLPKPSILQLVSAPARLSALKEIADDHKETEVIHSISFDAFLKLIGPLMLSTVGTLLLLLLHVTLFEYGYSQFTENLSAYRHFLSGSNQNHGPDSTDKKINCTSNGFGVVYDRSDSAVSAPNMKPSACLGNPGTFTRRPSFVLGSEMLHPFVRGCLYRYTPHIVSLVGTLFVVAFKIPLMWDCIQVYRASRHKLMLASPVCGIITLCAWLIAWFAFSLKPAWKFQVNLPLQTLTGFSVSGNVENFPHSNGLEYNGQMMGSMIRPASVNAYRDPYGRLAANGAVLGPPFAPDSGSIYNQGGLTSSPVYACFHDPGNGYLGAGQRVMRLISSAEGETACTNPINVQQVTDHAAEELEASSGRQSRNNYVCLQTALGTGHNGALAHNIAVPMENGVFVTRLETGAPPTSQLGSYLSHDAIAMMSSPSSTRDAMDDDRHSAHPMNEIHGMYSTLNGNRHSSRPGGNKGAQYSPVATAGSSFLSPVFSSGPVESGLYTSHSSAPKDVTSTETIMDSTALVPRVTFKENIDVITHGSPDASMRNPECSNERKGKCYQKPDLQLSSSTPSDSSGTYDNTFPSTFRGSFAVRGEASKQDNDGSGTLQRGQLMQLPMNGSIHSPVPMQSFHQTSAASSEATDPLHIFGHNSISPALQTLHSTEMIGETSFHTPNDDRLPLSSRHASDEEKRLCSQV